MIDYIIKRSDGFLEVSDNNRVTILNQAILGYLNQLAFPYFRTIPTILTITRKRLKCTQKVPIYIHSKLILLQIEPLRAKTSLLINYSAIAQIIYNTENYYTISFKSGAILKCSQHQVINKQMKYAIKLIDLLEINQ